MKSKDILPAIMIPSVTITEDSRMKQLSLIERVRTLSEPGSVERPFRPNRILTTFTSYSIAFFEATPDTTILFCSTQNKASWK